MRRVVAIAMTVFLLFILTEVAGSEVRITKTETRIPGQGVELVRVVKENVYGELDLGVVSGLLWSFNKNWDWIRLVIMERWHVDVDIHKCTTLPPDLQEKQMASALVLLNKQKGIAHGAIVLALDVVQEQDYTKDYNAVLKEKLSTCEEIFKEAGVLLVTHGTIMTFRGDDDSEKPFTYSGPIRVSRDGRAILTFYNVIENEFDHEAAQILNRLVIFAGYAEFYGQESNTGHMEGIITDVDGHTTYIAEYVVYVSKPEMDQFFAEMGKSLERAFKVNKQDPIGYFMKERRRLIRQYRDQLAGGAVKKK